MPTITHEITTGTNTGTVPSPTTETCNLCGTIHAKGCGHHCTYFDNLTNNLSNYPNTQISGGYYPNTTIPTTTYPQTWIPPTDGLERLENLLALMLAAIEAQTKVLEDLRENVDIANMPRIFP
jgi:hypothetical protein